jgi:acyl phosphate:glycerol-3-phosphate acyltransferase
LTFEFLALLIGAYFLGSIPTAYLVTKWRRGIDIRRFGSGNVGLSNAAASGSRWTILIVFGVDFLKGALPVFLTQIKAIDLPVYQQAAVGVAAICGHNWTIFLRFSGGRGVLTTLGVLFVLIPWLALVGLAFNCIFLPSRQFSLGTFIVLIAIPVLSWFANNLFGISQSVSLTLGLTAITLILFIRRLTAPRSEFSTSVSAGELVLNRLLFDRDIRDRAKWLNRKPPELMLKQISRDDTSNIRVNKES